ncbi:MAG: putative RNA-binding protein, YhbY family [Glomeribacter sp. 1016415]|uniref:RNA binding protein n=1 Tax=Mycoavidus cysteinexigens TaxID=1553431 RepID=A0A2Z6EXV6_9BURK|nr:YhbY family RNA-binding protein [Mycoavidus cysteinexigens]MCX8566348.1 putative RNA-binding protein, YhbY family [Glomeribacter sp. 1016415]BBE10232.1 RNA binding protein [Mycoavidus cysteinexigens]GAM53405.1 RNA binding protein [bacterium endosymbiont of Mortierella elongata FMR23-6]GLR00649.1 hypothetical protein GCM10007934_04600 [Mycoavidus cysteinexigens]
MPALSLTPAKRAALRAQAHALKPVVMIGADGLTEAVVAEIEKNLSAHELIKIRVLGDDRDTRIAIYQDICEQLNAAPIQHIGKLLLIWRALAAPQPKVGKASKGASPRLVTIIKPNANPSRRPQAKDILVRGNERVTTGGLIKKAKKRQTSTKRQHQSEK